MTDPIQNDLTAIFQAALDRADPGAMVRRHLFLRGGEPVIDPSGKDNTDGETIRVSDFKRVVVIGSGKATAKMANAVESVLGDRISDGLISVKHRPDPFPSNPAIRIRVIEAGHPVPNGKSVEAAVEIAKIADRADAETLVILLISGGGSALMAAPFESEDIRLPLAEKQATTSALLASGATIGEINCIRKHLSLIKGGRLAQRIAPAKCVGLILSDVVGDRLDTIASGPTAGDETTFRDMEVVFSKYDLGGKAPDAVKRILAEGLAGRIPDTPTSDDEAVRRVRNVLIGTNYDSLVAAGRKAADLGYTPLILTSHLEGEAREVAKLFSAMGKEIVKRGVPVKPPCCVIAGGETTVTLRGEGKGGRNQEMALAVLAEMERDSTAMTRLRFLSGATDGDDGPTDAAGAFAFPAMLCAAREKGFSIADFLKRNDAYTFFDTVGGLLRTGPTNTNVCDVQLLIVA